MSSTLILAAAWLLARLLLPLELFLLSVLIAGLAGNGGARLEWLCALASEGLRWRGSAAAPDSPSLLGGSPRRASPPSEAACAAAASPEPPDELPSVAMGSGARTRPVRDQ